MSNIGSGKGKTSGHGHLEQKTLSGGSSGRDPASKETVNLDNLQLFVDMDRLDTSNKITIRSFQHLTAKLDIEVSQASESGFKAVEAASGSITRRVRTPRKLTYYTNYGYLSLEIQVKKALANASNSE
ncbi:Ribosomal protein L18e/L15P [Phytophthora cactorum]|nr:Ribosomal protein L18e/L15P [Phytophthora cactorum]